MMRGSSPWKWCTREVKCQGGKGLGGHLVPEVGGESEAAAGGDVQSEATASLGPFIGLSAGTAPTRRTIASRVGKMPTESVRRRISLFKRSVGWGGHLPLAGESTRSAPTSPWGTP